MRQPKIITIFVIFTVLAFSANAFAFGSPTPTEYQGGERPIHAEVAIELLARADQEVRVQACHVLKRTPVGNYNDQQNIRALLDSKFPDVAHCAYDILRAKYRYIFTARDLTSLRNLSTFAHGRAFWSDLAKAGETVPKLLALTGGCQFESWGVLRWGFLRPKDVVEKQNQFGLSDDCVTHILAEFQVDRADATNFLWTKLLMFPLGSSQRAGDSHSPYRNLLSILAERKLGVEREIELFQRVLETDDDDLVRHLMKRFHRSTHPEKRTASLLELLRTFRDVPDDALNVLMAMMFVGPPEAFHHDIGQEMKAIVNANPTMSSQSKKSILRYASWLKDGDRHLKWGLEKGIIENNELHYYVNRSRGYPPHGEPPCSSDLASVLAAELKRSDEAIGNEIRYRHHCGFPTKKILRSAKKRRLSLNAWIPVKTKPPSLESKKKVRRQQFAAFLDGKIGLWDLSKKEIGKTLRAIRQTWKLSSDRDKGIKLASYLEKYVLTDVRVEKLMREGLERDWLSDAYRSIWLSALNAYYQTNAKTGIGLRKSRPKLSSYLWSNVVQVPGPNNGRASYRRMIASVVVAPPDTSYAFIENQILTSAGELSVGCDRFPMKTMALIEKHVTSPSIFAKLEKSRCRDLQIPMKDLRQAFELMSTSNTEYDRRRGYRIAMRFGDRETIENAIVSFSKQ